MQDTEHFAPSRCEACQRTDAAVGWAWFLLFGLNALVAAYKPDIFF